MSIAPFLPGIPAPAVPATPGGAAPTTSGSGGTTSGAPAEEGELAFGDALAAALAGAVPVLAELSAAPADLAAVPTGPSVAHAVQTATTGPVPGLVASGQRVPDAALGQSVATGDAIATPRLPVARGEGATVPAVPAAPSLQAVPAGYDASTPDSTSGPSAVAMPDAAGPGAPTAGSGGSTAGYGGASDHSSGQTSHPGGTTDGSAAPIAGSSGPTATVGPPATGSRVERAVVQQVFPEVTRVVSSAGNGTHRITLTLQPEQLGEVRVTLVVRDGSVHVRLAGGEGGDSAAVHRALASGAPELQRLLERSGTEARISVRDAFGQLASTAPTPPAAPTNASGTTSQQTGPQTGQQTGQQTDHQAAADARTHDGQDRSGRDQPRDRRDHPSDPSRAHDQVRPVVVPDTAQRSGRLDRTV